MRHRNAAGVDPIERTKNVQLAASISGRRIAQGKDFDLQKRSSLFMRGAVSLLIYCYATDHQRANRIVASIVETNDDPIPSRRNVYVINCRDAHRPAVHHVNRERDERARRDQSAQVGDHVASLLEF